MLAEALFFSAVLFVIGVFGVLIRRNAIIVFMGVELMLNAVNLNLVAFDAWWHDQLDWVGGYPFETATPAAIVTGYQARGYQLERSELCRPGGSGCNQFVFRRMPADG